MASNTGRKPAPLSRSSEVLWFVARESVLKGPFTTADLQEKVNRREISFLDFCWRNGFSEWRPIGSLDDFDRRSRLRTLPPYPGVEVPGSATGGGALSIDAAAVLDAKSVGGSRKQKHFYVSLSRARRYSITNYEWGLAALLGLLLSYVVSSFALSEVRRQFLLKVNQIEAGRAEEFLGRSEAPLGPYAYEPMFSAPEFKAVQSVPGLINLSVEVSGSPQRSTKDGSHSILGMKIRFASMPSVWSASDWSLDPVYARQWHVRGELGNDLESVNVLFDGDPILKP